MSDGSVRIVMLDDGETWSTGAIVLDLSPNGYTRLLDGAKLADLEGSDIIDMERIP